MKPLVLLPALLLCGCAWLESVDLPARPRLALPEAEVQQITQQALALRARAEQVRVAIAAEADRHVRMQQYRELRDLDDERLPLERRLEDAGRPLPSAVTAPSGT
ncbi:MAG: hypothetical protein HYX47_08225 [Burkholderiales bacterium]|nr:hypothetical protein [Burkholderiales bacterium]